MDETTKETFYVLLYPLNDIDTLVYISVDFAKRVVKTLKKPIHRMRANKWFQGLKSNSFQSLSASFDDVDDEHIKTVAEIINNRPNVLFEPNSNLIELQDLQVSFIYVRKFY